ncbi:MAG: hypothetical protein ABFS37_12985 [Acidobacteriota bacterium]
MSSKTVIPLLCVLLLSGCGGVSEVGDIGKTAMPVPPPDRLKAAGEPAVYPDPELGPVAPADPVVLGLLPRIADDPIAAGWVPRPRTGRPEVPISPEEADRRREQSLRLNPQGHIQIIETLGNRPQQSRAPSLETSFESINFDDGNGQTPPDPEMAAGPNHLIAVVNSMVEVYDTSGSTLSGPVATDTFFSGVAGCSNTFDPNTLYDEKEDRFFIGIDSYSGPGTDNGYCFAVSATGDPTGTWYRYSFDATANAGDFFDYPQAGIGDEAIFMAGNVFGSSYHADVWAIKKSDVYNNLAATVVRRTVNGSLSRPMNAHGHAQGTWPNGNTHYLMVDYFNGTTMGVQEWTDPFGANTFTSLGTVDLNSASGVTGGYPIDTPQMGSANDIQGNDYRIQDAEYRNGHIWLAHTIACNPGQGTVNCVRWAEIDPTSGGLGYPSVVQSGVFSSDGEYRIFPNLAVNHCNDVTIGFTKSSDSMFPAVFFTGRLGSDSSGTVQDEALLKVGEVAHSSYDDPPYRWGDYSGATPDPNGVDTWYLGEYTRENSLSSKWGTFIGRFSTDCQAQAPVSVFSDGFETGDRCRWSAAVGDVDTCP